MLVLSHVSPSPEASGQALRVANSLRALRRFFRVTLALPAGACGAAALRELCDESIEVPQPAGARRLAYRAAAWAWAARTGLKTSNFWIANALFSRENVERMLEGRRFDCALFEYFHAAERTAELKSRGIPCALDMHNLMWKAYELQLKADGGSGAGLARAVATYRRAEEDAWRKFDAIIAINRDERAAVAAVHSGASILEAGMGVDLSKWPYSRNAVEPPRLAFYGGLSGAENRRSAERTIERIMPLVWAAHPAAELWVIGSNPPERIRAAARDPRVRVTGFVADPAPLLGSAAAVLCPWEGRYGFRSRLIEAMAAGAPVIASPDAYAGMGLEEGEGLLPAESDEAFAAAAGLLLRNQAYGEEQSRRARAQAAGRFSFEATYVRLAQELRAWARERRSATAAAR